MNRRLVSFVVAALIGGGIVVLSGGPASAEPATTLTYSAGGTATMYQGMAFDTCTAPPLPTMQAWMASPYRAVGVYIGGANRSCAQPALTASWASSVTQLGWALLPIYLGRQAPCSDRTTSIKITPGQAARQAISAAGAAVTAARSLGMWSGTAIYADMENYSTTDTACRTTVLQYLSAWTKELHRRGYLSGVYANLSSGAAHLSTAFGSSTYARPDALWVARWDLSPSLTGWAGVPNARWAVHQRAKQYRGDHAETWGGVTLNIDNDQLDAPVASIYHRFTVSWPATVGARSGPSTSYPVVTTHASGSALNVMCQSPGQQVSTSTVWDRLGDGTWLPDHYVSTPSDSGFSPPTPRCFYPYQVTPTTGVNTRSSASASAPVTGNLPYGGLAWIFCQRPGSRVGTTSVWDRTESGDYATDLYVASPSKTTYSAPIQRC